MTHPTGPARRANHPSRLPFVVMLAVAGLACLGLLVVLATGTARDAGPMDAFTGSAETSPSAKGAPVIGDVSVFDVTQTSAAVTWTTDVPATGQLEYGITIAYGRVTTPELTLDYLTHLQEIDELLPGTLYHFRVLSSNRAGVDSDSGDLTFHTLSTSAPAASVTPVPSADPTPRPTPTPAYDAVFTGDATGETDVTTSLRSFLQSHNGERVALAVNGIYKVSSVAFTAKHLTVDFRGSQLQGSVVGDPVLELQEASHVVLNDPAVNGTGYVWAYGTQWEHGIAINGGSHIALNRPVTRDTRGDGIYVGYSYGYNSPAMGVVIDDPDIARAARNGVAPVAGQVTIRGGHIAHTGLMSIDFEANDATGAGSIQGVVDGVDVRSHGDLPAARAWCTCYAVAAGGASSATKPSITVQNLTGDNLRMTIKDTANAIVRDNVSDIGTFADFPGSSAVTFSGNILITRR